MLMWSDVSIPNVLVVEGEAKICSAVGVAFLGMIEQGLVIVETPNWTLKGLYIHMYYVQLSPPLPITTMYVQQDW